MRRVEEFQASVQSRMLTLDDLDGPALLDILIDVYVDFLDHHPDFRAIALGRRRQCSDPENNTLKEKPDRRHSSSRFCLRAVT